jgi:fumarate hydratase class II
VGTGLNTHPDFAARFAAEMAERTGLDFRTVSNTFAAIGAQDTAVELSGQLRVIAISLLKIATDLRWMNSGPVSGLGEIRLPELQPGSSIMPGKVNPVIPEAVGMACVQVIGLDAAVALAAQDNRFQLATMLPLIAYDLLQQLALLTGATRSLEEQAITRFEANVQELADRARRNAMLATALSPRIGYDLAGRIAKRALEQGRAVIELEVPQRTANPRDWRLFLELAAPAVEFPYCGRAQLLAGRRCATPSRAGGRRGLLLGRPSCADWCKTKASYFRLGYPQQGKAGA